MQESNPPSSVQTWYEENASRFAAAVAIENPFVGMEATAQQRLNRFRLWFLEHGGLVNFAGSRVLEFGAGHGRLALAFPTMRSYLGVDYSRNLVEIGCRRIAEAGLADRAQLVHGDCNDYEGEREGFDIVCSLGMFPHVSDPVLMLKRMLWHLRPNGVLFLDYRAASMLYRPIRSLKNKWSPSSGGRVYMWSSGRMMQMMKEAGLGHLRLVMRDYPFLPELYARIRSEWPLVLRNSIAEKPLFHPFATAGWAFGRKL